jgi:hypothetical protein
MYIEQISRKLAAKNNAIKIGIGGLAGTGKSYLAVMLALGICKDLKITDISWFDNEGGSKFFIDDFKREKINVHLSESLSLRDLQLAYKAYQEKEIGLILIDSATLFYKQLIDDYKTVNKIPYAKVNHYNYINQIWEREFTRPYAETEANIIFTGRGGYLWGKEEDEVNDDGKVIDRGNSVRDEIKFRLPAEASHEPDLVIWQTAHNEPKAKNKLDICFNSQILKDRSRLIQSKMFKMTKYQDIQPFVKFVSSLKPGEVSTRSHSSSVIVPNTDREYIRRQEMKNIELEKITGILDKYGLSASGNAGKDQKQISALVFEKLFKTLSWTEVQNKDLEELQGITMMLENFLLGVDENVLSDKAKLKSYIQGYKIAA